MSFVVAGESAVGGDPGERPFDHLPAGQDDEPVFVGLAHDRDRGFHDRGCPVHQVAGEPAVGPAQTDRGNPVVQPEQDAPVNVRSAALK